MAKPKNTKHISQAIEKMLVNAADRITEVLLAGGLIIENQKKEFVPNYKALKRLKNFLEVECEENNNGNITGNDKRGL